jgi:hypothetical protein
MGIPILRRVRLINMGRPKKPTRFEEILSKTLSVSRPEMQRRVKEDPPEKMAIHKRFSYRPSKASSSSSS